MKAGYWVNVRTGIWYEIGDHAAWLRRYDNARLAGLSDEAARRIGNMAYRAVAGPDRVSILYAGFAQGLARVRGHGDHVTIESTLSLQELVPALAPFMSQHFGPLTWVRLNSLPAGPFLARTYQDIAMALELGELAALLPREGPLDLSGLPKISPEAALDKADRLQEIIKAGLARGERLLP
jgi:hypothetical protein